MTLSFKSLLVGAALCSLGLSATMQQAKAEVFFIDDATHRFSISFPDSWKRIANQKPDDMLTVTGAGQNNFADCRVRVNNDRRHVIHPPTLDAEIQRIEVSADFWDNYLSDYNNVEVQRFKDNAGLGYGHASMAEASYETTEGATVRKRGLMFASLYHDQMYVFECSSEETVYDEWRQTFLGIAKSVDFGVVTNDKTKGHYRDFTNEDEKVEVQGDRAADVFKF